MNELTPKVARTIIQRVGDSGQPPEYGSHFFTAGLEPYLDCLEGEYLSTFIGDGGSAFKLILGVYGGGKTHFQYCLRDLAWKHKFAISYVQLSPESTPFHKLESVYAAIAGNLMDPLSPEELMSGCESGIDPFLRRWYGRKYEEFSEAGQKPEEIVESIKFEIEKMDHVESSSYLNAVRGAVMALATRQDGQYTSICQWLKGEGFDPKAHRQAGILEKIDKTTAFKMIRSLVQVVRQLGNRGLVLLLDEAEQKSSMSSRQKATLLSNLRELADACGHSNFSNVLVTYAVPDESFLEGNTQVYEALRQRLSTVFEELNPTGVKIDLEKTTMEPVQFLAEVGKKLGKVYQVAYDCQFDETELGDTIDLVARQAYEQRFADVGYRRLFVKMMVKGLHYLRIKKSVPDEAAVQVGG